MKRIFVLAIGLGVATAALISLAGNYLPYSATRDAVTDALTRPGGFIASLVYPEGVHTGGGAPTWGFIAMASNAIVYVLFWYVCLKMLQRRSAQR